MKNKTTNAQRIVQEPAKRYLVDVNTYMMNGSQAYMYFHVASCPEAWPIP